MSASLTSRSAGIRILLQQIRTHEKMRGTRKAIPWSGVTKYIEGLNPTYNFQEDAYKRWFNNPDRGVDEKVLINVELFVQHFEKYTDRGARSAARAASRRILDEEINLGDEWSDAKIHLLVDLNLRSTFRWILRPYFSRRLKYAPPP